MRWAKVTPKEFSAMTIEQKLAWGHAHPQEILDALEQIKKQEHYLLPLSVAQPVAGAALI